MHKSKPELKGDLAFVLTFVKVLIESEAPSSKIRSVLAECPWGLAPLSRTEVFLDKGDSLAK